MRSLTLLTCQAGKVHGKKAAARYTSLAVRNEATSLSHPDDKETLYLASERPLPDGGVEVQVFVANSQLGESNTVSVWSDSKRISIMRHVSDIGQERRLM